jgi:hypothetical protein
MSNEAEFVTEADCVLCRRLASAQRAAMRADLLEIPLSAIDNICEQCLGAFWANLQASFPKTEEEKMRRRAERAASGGSAKGAGPSERGRAQVARRPTHQDMGGVVSRPLPSPADYYDLVARAVATLDANTSEARQALYERARAALTTQLRGRNPPVTEQETIREQRALAAAIHKVENMVAQERAPPQQPSVGIKAAVPRPSPIAETPPVPHRRMNKAINAIKGVGLIAFGIACFAGMLLLLATFVLGLTWVSVNVIEYLLLAVAVAIMLCLFILLPLALFRRTRSVSFYGFFIFSFLFGATTWVMGFLTTFQHWGWPGVFIGLFLGFVGIVPLGIIASALHSDWWSVVALVVGLIITYGARSLALGLANSLERS